jgi:hypothetical protein
LITNTVALQKAKNSFNAALYVISQPFNFLNKNTETSEKWFFYFDVNNFKMIGNKVMLKDHTQFYF